VAILALLTLSEGGVINNNYEEDVVRPGRLSSAETSPEDLLLESDWNIEATPSSSVRSHRDSEVLSQLMELQQGILGPKHALGKADTVRHKVQQQITSEIKAAATVSKLSQQAVAHADRQTKVSKRLALKAKRRKAKAKAAAKAAARAVQRAEALAQSARVLAKKEIHRIRRSQDETKAEYNQRFLGKQEMQRAQGRKDRLLREIQRRTAFSKHFAQKKTDMSADHIASLKATAEAQRKKLFDDVESKVSSEDKPTKHVQVEYSKAGVKKVDQKAAGKKKDPLDSSVSGMKTLSKILARKASKQQKREKTSGSKPHSLTSSVAGMDNLSKILAKKKRLLEHSPRESHGVVMAAQKGVYKEKARLLQHTLQKKVAAIRQQRRAELHRSQHLADLRSKVRLAQKKKWAKQAKTDRKIQEAQLAEAKAEAEAREGLRSEKATQLELEKRRAQGQGLRGAVHLLKPSKVKDTVTDKPKNTVKDKNKEGMLLQVSSHEEQAWPPTQDWVTGRISQLPSSRSKTYTPTWPGIKREPGYHFKGNGEFDGGKTMRSWMKDNGVKVPQQMKEESRKFDFDSLEKKALGAQALADKPGTGGLWPPTNSWVQGPVPGA